jgi:predicted  nucleic acid-binding Zn ribbon protein
MLARIVVPGVEQASEEQLDALEGYVVALWWNGQIHGDYLLSRAPLAAYVDIPRSDSLHTRLLSPRGKAELALLKERTGRAPVGELLESLPPKRYRSWRSASSLYLFTHAFDSTSAVCAGDFPGVIPLYSLPVSISTREALQSWAEDYREFDRLWFASEDLETMAYRRLADPASKLSVAGRKLCRTVERATGKPTYYFLMRYHARRHGEEERPCPGCGGRWSMGQQVGKTPRVDWFDFCCQRCRLVSHCGASIDGARLARIGDFDGRLNTPGRVTSDVASAKLARAVQSIGGLAGAQADRLEQGSRELRRNWR